jgi:hypothetical protein
MGRYVARPPIATDRLSQLEDGRLELQLKRPWRDGTTALRYTAHELIERLIAIVPRPRANLGRYSGVSVRCSPSAERPGGGGKLGACRNSVAVIASSDAAHRQVRGHRWRREPPGLAARHQVGCAAFRHWLYLLRDGERGRRESTRRRQGAARMRAISMPLVEVAAASLADDRFELDLGDGRRLPRAEDVRDGGPAAAAGDPR